MTTTNLPVRRTASAANTTYQPVRQLRPAPRKRPTFLTVLTAALIVAFLAGLMLNLTTT